MFSYEVDGNTRTVFTTVSGVVKDDDLLAHANTVVADPRIPPGSKVLMDFRAVTRFEVTAKALWRTADVFRGRSPFARTAFVANVDVIYGMGRMYQSIRAEEDSGEIEVFRELQDAKDWLGLG